MSELGGSASIIYNKAAQTLRLPLLARCGSEGSRLALDEYLSFIPTIGSERKFGIKCDIRRSFALKQEKPTER